jgi:hypothetical protein
MLQITQKLLPEWSEEDISRTYKDLEIDNIQKASLLTTMITDQGYHQLERQLTPFGQKVVAYLKNPVQDE